MSTTTPTTKTAIAIALAEDPISTDDIIVIIENGDIPQHVKDFLINL